MTGLTKIVRFFFLIFVAAVLPETAFPAQIVKGDISIDYTPLADGTIKVNYAVNKSSGTISIYVDGKDAATILAHSSAQIQKVARKTVMWASSTSTGAEFWRYKAPASPQTVEEMPQETAPDSNKTSTAPVVRRKQEKIVSSSRPVGTGGYAAVIERLGQDSFFGTEAVASYVQKTDSFINTLTQSQNKEQFLIDNDIEKFLKDSEEEIKIKKDEIPTIAQDLVVSSKITDSSSQTAILNSVVEILNNRLNQREAAFFKLQNAVSSIPTETENEHLSKESIINYSIIGAIVLILLIWIIIAVRKKKNKAKSKQQADLYQQHDSDPNNPAIVVRRRTTSILKKQSIDDVINNSEYLLINSSEFTPDSAVRNIYIKNTCIKEVYNLYAEDLRNTSNPKEDGCMVLGRWVYSEDTHTYDISLETVVFPGDDAVFKEYELNFGGKIKLRIVEKLRKLRRETNLQYDLVCWIHSHPGLGVFFSNSDDNVQMQLKHSQHPNFLIAFVVDILTSDQEMGIFTFRKDGSMNSKGDLTKLYSLEDMYKWALESDKASFNPDNYHNILGSAKMRIPNCNGIELNNSSIIDLTQIVIEPATGIVGWAVGTSVEVNGGMEYVVSGIVKADEKPSTGMIGALVNVTHMSLPTIQRLIANENSDLSFVMVYSSKQNTLTSIPVINGELITDEHFYGEETIDDLKIWTRRKR